MILKFLQRTGAFLLYSNLFIALCALALGMQHFALMGAGLNYPLLGEMMAATLCIYALHRIVSLKKLDESVINERFEEIRRLRRSIYALFVLGTVLGGICFFMLSWPTQLALVSPALISLGYVLPVWKTKRLRDVHLLKIFLVALVWSFVTVFLPAMELGQPWDFRLLFMLAERALFIFAITLPFDIRDLKIEAYNQVKTIPGIIGVKTTIYLALSCLLLWLLGCFFLYEIVVFIPLLIVGLVTMLLVAGSHPNRSDWYYTALLDGTMLFQGILVWGTLEYIV